MDPFNDCRVIVDRRNNGVNFLPKNSEMLRSISEFFLEKTRTFLKLKVEKVLEILKLSLEIFFKKNKLVNFHWRFQKSKMLNFWKFSEFLKLKSFDSSDSGISEFFF